MSLFNLALETCKTQLLLDSLYNGILVCGRGFSCIPFRLCCPDLFTTYELSAYMSLFMDVTVYEACLLDWLWG